MTEFCALSHTESGRHIAQTPAIFSTQGIQVIGILRDQDLSINSGNLDADSQRRAREVWREFLGNAVHLFARDNAWSYIVDRIARNDYTEWQVEEFLHEAGAGT